MAVAHLVRYERFDGLGGLSYAFAPGNPMQVAQNASSVRPLNIGWRLDQTASRMPEAIAVAMPIGGDSHGHREYARVTFRELEQDTNTLAASLQRMGIRQGARIVLMVPPSIDFIALSFALFKVGAVIVLIDPGMGRRHLLRCLEEVKPEGFVAIPLVHGVRSILARRFSSARWNVTVGRRWFWRGPTLHELRNQRLDPFQAVTTTADDPAAIIFTSGSTGPPKGVLYRHGNFNQQVEQIRDYYGIQPGEVDLPGFPLFALFNAAMGVTTVIPDMNSTRPARVDPRRIVQAVRDWKVTQAFGSPAMWNVVGQYCQQQGVRLPSVRRVLSAGAPVPPHVLERMKNAIAEDGEVHTPYGATEALPVASITATEVLGQTAQASAQGAGTCVGRPFDGIEWKVIRIADRPLLTLGETELLPAHEIGELIVRGRVVTDRYVTGTASNQLAKISDGPGPWHRMGDVGYLDGQNRFWFCGRKAHRVLTSDGPMYTVCCEAIFNQHPRVYRSALVGVGPPGGQTPVVIVEPWPGRAPKRSERHHFVGQLAQLAGAHRLTETIAPQHILIRSSLPVDVRHNAKIFREELAEWAQRKLGRAVTQKSSRGTAAAK